MVRLNLTGVGEGLSVSVTTILSGADYPDRVLTSIQNLFPSFTCTLPDNAEFPVEREVVLTSENIELNVFLNVINEQKTLDTALDAMSLHLEDDSTTFQISRQAALANKVAFPLPGESPLGGTITVKISGIDLADWLEAATWHQGRDTIPRHVGDEYGMDKTGDAVTWH